MSAWVWLTMAIVFEVAGTMSLKISYGLTKTVPSILTGVFYLICFYSLAISLKTLDVSLAYAIWAALGTALIATLGIVYFGEPMSLWKAIFLTVIIVGVIGLHLSNSHR